MFAAQKHDTANKKSYKKYIFQKNSYYGECQTAFSFFPYPNLKRMQSQENEDGFLHVVDVDAYTAIYMRYKQ